MAGHSRSLAEASAAPPSDPGGLDLGIDAILEDDRTRGAESGLGAARRLGQWALEADEFLSATQRRAIDRARRPALSTSVFQLEGVDPEPPRPAPRRRALPIAIGAAILALAGAAVVVLQLA